MHIGNEENVRTIKRHETHMGGTSTHPRPWGTFPRFLGHCARELSLTSLPEMITHLTSRLAKRSGIYPHRGLIAEGSAADLVRIDPETVKDMATIDDPKVPSQG